MCLLHAATVHETLRATVFTWPGHVAQHWSTLSCASKQKSANCTKWRGRTISYFLSSSNPVSNPNKMSLILNFLLGQQ